MPVCFIYLFIYYIYDIIIYLFIYLYYASLINRGIVSLVIENLAHFVDGTVAEMCAK